MNLNFSISELIYSDYAVAHKINNMPDIRALDNMLVLIVKCLQPLRDKLGKPITITSGYRNKTLNKAVGGAETSHHLTGQAVDISVRGLTAKQLFDLIAKTDIKYTQLIEEHSGSANWVHISYVKTNLKCEKLKYINGKYILIH